MDVADLRDRETVQRLWEIAQWNFNALDASAAPRTRKSNHGGKHGEPYHKHCRSGFEHLQVFCRQYQPGRQQRDIAQQGEHEKRGKEARREQCCDGDAIRKCPGQNGPGHQTERHQTTRDQQEPGACDSEAEATR